VRPEGTTPLPSTLVPLIVKSWSLNASGTAAESPAYTLEVLGSPGDPGAPPVVLKSITVKPDPSWFRSSPNAPEPTLEVSLP
jgi:hypothetical protein